MTLFIAIGNPLRGDDGVAHEVLARLEGDSLSVLQLTPEIADEIAAYDRVVFIDADAAAGGLRVEQLSPFVGPNRNVTHVMSPASVVALSRKLFGFTGQAYVCRLPAADFSAGAGITEGTLHYASEAADQLRQTFAR